MKSYLEYFWSISRFCISFESRDTLLLVFLSQEAKTLRCPALASNTYQAWGVWDEWRDLLGWKHSVAAPWNWRRYKQDCNQSPLRIEGSTEQPSKWLHSSFSRKTEERGSLELVYFLQDNCGWPSWVWNYKLLQDISPPNKAAFKILPDCVALSVWSDIFTFCWCQSDVLPKHHQLVDLCRTKRHLTSKSKEIHHPQILLPNLHRWTHELNQTSKPGTCIDRNVCSLKFQLEKGRNWRWLEHFSIPLGAFCPETIRNEISARGSLTSIMIYDARNLWQIARLRIVLNQSLLHFNLS